MGVCVAVSVVVPRGQQASRARSSGGIEWSSLHGEDGLPVALDAARSPSLGGGVSADEALDGGGLF